ncbi:unnamed protein product [Victoria cruziana]
MPRRVCIRNPNSAASAEKSGFDSSARKRHRYAAEVAAPTEDAEDGLNGLNTEQTEKEEGPGGGEEMRKK